jgi:uncharacterized protein
MKQINLENPFPATAYYGPKYFCDREEESTRLLSYLENRNSTTLISVRRMGKTGLLHHVIAKLPYGWIGIYVDILETENLTQFLNLLATSILQAVPEKSSLGKQFWEFIKSMRPVVSFDSLTGIPQISFNINQKETEVNINSIFTFLERLEERIAIAIDEFQQIVEYPEKNVDAWLRTRIQQLKNVFFIFSGSRQHLMGELFSLPSRPFYRSTIMMKLGKIDNKVYNDFIVAQFGRYNKTITPEIVAEILDWTNTHTFYVQQLCSRIFSETPKVVTSDLWKQQAYLLLKEQEPIFFAHRNMLTPPQWQLLKAIAHEGTVYQPTSNAFLRKHHLGTSATVLRSLKTLTGYELIYTEYDEMGTSYYSVYDVFIQRWAQRFLIT